MSAKLNAVSPASSGETWVRQIWSPNMGRTQVGAYHPPRGGTLSSAGRFGPNVPDYVSSGAGLPVYTSSPASNAGVLRTRYVAVPSR